MTPDPAIVERFKQIYVQLKVIGSMDAAREAILRRLMRDEWPGYLETHDAADILSWWEAHLAEHKADLLPEGKL